jgi:hypothetical protein
MEKEINNIPERIAPYIISRELNQPVLAVKGPFMLVGPREGTLESDLIFRWAPSTAVEFNGTFPHTFLDLDAPWSLLAGGDTAFRAPIHITNTTTTLEEKASRVSGILLEPLNLGASCFEVLQFSLANFPSYLGESIRYECEDGSGLIRGRLHLTSSRGVCNIDVVRETDEFRARKRQDTGFFISHVGQWLPSDGGMAPHAAEEILEMLRVWFGFLRGAWTGPLFPQGLCEGNVAWQQFAAWRLRESRSVTTWLPEHKRLDLAGAFSRFAELWADSAWRGPLKLAVSWFIEANGSGLAPESKIVLAQVALELLAWVHLVETQGLYNRRKFNKLSAAGKIRALLEHLKVPTAIPDYLAALSSLRRGKVFDGPAAITTVRNNSVHATHSGRAAVRALSAEELFECSQLALQYIELTLLAICGYAGHYARRGWRGWKGDDEVLVPWR